MEELANAVELLDIQMWICFSCLMARPIGECNPEIAVMMKRMPDDVNAPAGKAFPLFKSLFHIRNHGFSFIFFPCFFAARLFSFVPAPLVMKKTSVLCESCRQK
jgi:hypothetical protein